MKRSGVIRTFAVFTGGVVVSVVSAAIFEHLLTADSGYLIHKIITGVPPDQQGALLRQLNHSVAITIFVVNPLVGVTVGVFVGLLQRTRAVMLAMCCLIPDFVVGLVDDTRMVWTESARGIAIYAFHHAIPFIAAAATAGAVRYILTLRRARIEGAARA